MKKIISFALSIVLIACLFSINTFADSKEITVAPSGDNTGLTDFCNLRDALRDYDTINLLSGKTYVIGGSGKGALDVDSNTTINAKGATIKQVNAGKGIFKTDQEATEGGYNAMVNVTINGGTYIGNTKKGATISLMKFFHARNITISNATFKDIYSGHLLELAGCKDVLVENCYFGGKIGSDNTRNEAVELDNCSTGCLGLPKGSPFDNTACQNITFRNNTVVFSRTFGSHFTYGLGKGKFNRNIYVYNNNLTATKNEGLIVFNWYDSVIENNIINGTTVGVDIVNCFKGTYVDFRGGVSAIKKNNNKSYNIRLNNNKITSKKGYALWIRGVDIRPIFGVTATNNTLQTNQGFSKDKRGVIRIQDATKQGKNGINVTKSTVKKAKTEYFAYVTDSKGVKINSNKFYYKSKKIKTAVRYNHCKSSSAKGNKVKKG